METKDYLVYQGGCVDWWDRSSTSMGFRSGVHLVLGYCGHKDSERAGDITVSLHAACPLFEAKS